MIYGCLLLLIINSILCIRFEELPKYDTIKIIPDTRVYLDISSFEVGRSIYIEFTMDLFFSKLSKDSYTLQIGQVPSRFEDDYKYWSNLPNVTTKMIPNAKYASSYYTYTWVEMKKPGMKYIYIIPPEPYEKFYTFWKNKITITNIGGKSDRQIRNEILRIILPIISVIISVCIITSLIYYQMKKNKKNDKDYPPATTILELPIVNDPNCPPSSQFIPESSKDNVEYPKPLSPLGPQEQINN